MHLASNCNLLSFVMMILSKGDDDKATSSWVLGGDICIQLIQTLTALILLLGVFQENCSLLKPWLFTTILVLIAELAFLPSFPGRILIFSDYAWNWTRFFINLPFIIDDIYGFLVVYSYSCTLCPGSHVV
ncbi:hypothetical protein J6590_005425 [Homalodisca vitripennis]|nr:hypothetical protein J6590_005425 [Homalodisca vitripennis]